jgi:hypothetical protein
MYVVSACAPGAPPPVAALLRPGAVGWTALHATCTVQHQQRRALLPRHPRTADVNDGLECRGARFRWRSGGARHLACYVPPAPPAAAAVSPSCPRRLRATHSYSRTERAVVDTGGESSGALFVATRVHTFTLCSRSRRAHPGYPGSAEPRHATVVTESRTDGGKAAACRWQACQRIHKPQRPQSLCAKKCSRARSPQARDQKVPRNERRASSGAQRQQQCVSQPCAPQGPPMTAAAAHEWAAHRPPPRVTSTLVARGTTDGGSGGGACRQASSWMVVQPSAASPAR